ncbi:MAG: RNA polymerase sigma factor [Myxococcales bacterium]|nr:RNA polymerase sigma factor [Myxococcales bacterium]
MAPVSAEQLADLARRAQAGDAVATGELLRALYAVVRKQIHFILGSGPAVDDAVQDTMIALHRGLPGFRGEASPRTWAIAIAMRTARRQRRREARHPHGGDDVEVATFDVDQAGAAELAVMRRALATLDLKKREAFVVMGILELTAEEAGRALGTFANTAASRYRHARAELEAYLARRGDESLTTAPTARPPTRETP